MPMTAAHPDRSPPSPWVCRFRHLVPARGIVLDLAAGSGRHAEYFLQHSHPVVAVDRDTAALVRLAPSEIITSGLLEVITADLEAGAWPLGTRRFAGVIVTNYLHRPLFPALVGAVAPGGVLIYETFALGNERFGKPSNPDFLLRPGELLGAFAPALTIVAFEQGIISSPRPAAIQRLAAIKAALVALPA